MSKKQRPDLTERPHWTVLDESGNTWDYEATRGRAAERKARAVGGTCNWVDEPSMYFEAEPCDPALFGGEKARPIGGCNCAACEKARI